MIENFKLCLDETLKWEGGYSNHPSDPGGATNFGVIQVRYDEYNDDLGRPRKAVTKITKVEVDDIYKRYYWDKVNADNLPSGVDLIVFDFGVNSGPSRGVKALQKVLGTEQDGALGSATLTALAKLPSDIIINKYMDERERFLKSLKTFPTFGKGWLRRTAGIRAKAHILKNGRFETPFEYDAVAPNQPKQPQPLNWLEYLVHCLLQFFSKS